MLALVADEDERTTLSFLVHLADADSILTKFVMLAPHYALQTLNQHQAGYDELQNDVSRWSACERIRERQITHRVFIHHDVGFFAAEVKDRNLGILSSARVKHSDFMLVRPLPDLRSSVLGSYIVRQ